MQLLVYITNQTAKMPQLLASMMEHGVNGATVLNCDGMAHILAAADDVETPAFFNKVRSLFDDSHEHGKMMIAVMPDEKIADCKETIQKVCGKFTEPNTGILFTLPVMHFEGVSWK